MHQLCPCPGEKWGDSRVLRHLSAVGWRSKALGDLDRSGSDGDPATSDGVV